MDVRFSPDGSKIIAKGDGNITLKFKWDDDPSSAGLAVGELTVRGQTFRQRGKKGEKGKPLGLENVRVVVIQNLKLRGFILSNSII